MSTNKDEVEELKKTNIELAKLLDHWKITAAQRDREKFSLIQERNELKLKLNRIRSGGAAQMRQLDAALQAAIQETLTHLVEASNAVARTMELAKTYMRDRQELDASSPRWSRLSGTPPVERERINRVPPLLIGGQSIQPVVSLSRTLLNSSNSPSRNRSPSQQSRNVTERAVPMHILQDVYIPLTRIDAAEVLNNQMDDGTIDNSTEDLGLEGTLDNSEHAFDESQNSSDVADFENPAILQTVIEEVEPEVNDQSASPTASASCTENPLEGPSWLLDVDDTQTSRTQGRVTLEPDSTTELGDVTARAAVTSSRNEQMDDLKPPAARCAFTPTVRRRRRTSSPHLPHPPHPTPPRTNSINKRVLKVVVAKMKFDDEEGTSSASPPKKSKSLASPGISPILQSLHQKSVKGIPGPKAPEHPEQSDVDSPILQTKTRSRPTVRRESPKNMLRFDAPSPNGATDARAIVVSEQTRVASGSGVASVSTQAASRRDRQNSARNAVSERPCDAVDTDHASPEVHVTRRNTNRMKRDTSVSQRDTSASRRDTSVSRQDTDDAQSKTEEDGRGHDSRSVTPESEGGAEGRSRRPRKQVVYREKPLNRKLRR